MLASRAVTPEQLPARPPFALRARLLTPLAAGGTRHETRWPAGRRCGGAASPSSVPPASDPDEAAAAIDLRSWVLMPGLVDLHAHLPQVPSAGLGAGLELLTWLERYIFPLERGFDAAAADRLAPIVWRGFAAAGTTTAVVYGAVYEASLDATFRAAEAHGIRAVIGKVMMDRLTYDPTIDPNTILERSLRESAEPDRALAWPRRRTSSLRGHAALRRLVHGRHAARIGGAGRVDRDVLADAPVRGPGRDRRGRPAVPRGARLRRRVRPSRRPRGPGGPGPCRSPVRPRAGPAGRDRHARRPLPRLEPVPGVRRHAARALPGGRAVGRARLGRVGRPGPLDLQPRCGSASTPRTRCGWPAGPARCRSGRSTGSGWARSVAPRRSAWTRRSARSRRQGGRPDRGRSGVRGVGARAPRTPIPRIS